LAHDVDDGQAGRFVVVRNGLETWGRQQGSYVGSSGGISQNYSIPILAARHQHDGQSWFNNNAKRS